MYHGCVMNWLKRNGTSVAATLIAAALTIAFGSIAVFSLLGARYPERLDPMFTRMTGSVESGTSTNASAIIGLVFMIVVLVSAIIVIGLAFRQAWARESAFVIYGFLGLLVLSVSIGGLAGDPPAPSAWTGMLVGVANISIVVLLLLPPTSRAFRGGHRSIRLIEPG